MKHGILLLLGLFFSGLVAMAQSFQWGLAYGGVNFDYIYGVTTGAAGHVYATGNTYGTVDFDPGPGTAAQTTSVLQPYLVKYSPLGGYVWHRAFGIGINGGAGYSATLDAAENIYLTGTYTGTGDFDPGPGTYNMTSGGASFFVCKLDSVGNFLWARSVDMVPAGLLLVCEVALDGVGNILLAGTFNNTVDFDPGPGTYNLSAPGATFSDAFVLKLDPSGNFLWAQRYGGTNSESALGMALDQQGNIFLGGQHWGGAFGTVVGQNDNFFMKLDASGNVLWIKSVGTTNVDNMYDVALDAQGNVYGVGGYMGTMDFDPGPSAYSMTSSMNGDGFVLKLDTSGNFVWAKSFMGVGTGFTDGRAVSIDAAGSVWVGGRFAGTADFDPGAGSYTLTGNSTSYTDAFVLQMTAAGGFQSVVKWGGTSSTTIFEMAIDAVGNVISVGTYAGTVDLDPGSGVSSWTSNGQYDEFVHKWGVCSPPAAPVDTTPAANLSICIGDSTVLSAAGSGTLQWFTTAVGGSPVGIGGNFTTPALTSATTYYVQDSTCAAGGRTAITVTVNTAPSILNTTGGNVCDAGTVLLSAMASAGTLDWYDAPMGGNLLGSGGSFTTPLISTTTLYYVEAVIGSCRSQRVAVTATVLLSTASSLAPHVCAPGTYTSPSGNHIWAASGVYMYNLANANGCDSVLTITLTIDTVDVAVTASASTLTATATNATYQWIYCDSAPIPGATGANFTPSSSGNYAVIVQQNGCQDTSDCQVVNITGLESNDLGEVRVYPNPSSGKFYLSLAGTDPTPCSVAIMDLCGRVLFHQADLDVSSPVEINLHGFAAGTYLLEIVKGDMKQVVRLVME